MNWLKQISRLIACLIVIALLPRNALALVDDADPFIPQLIPVELQAWWLPDFGHIHAGTRLPLGQEVSGRLEFDVRIVLHNNPSHLSNLRIDSDTGIFTSIPLDLDCPYDGVNPNTCVFNVPVSLDTTQLQDGWRELRLRATTETPDNQSYLNSSGIMLDVQNGGVPNDVSFSDWCDYKSLTGRGWYGVFEYTNVVIECVPQTPISGVHTFRVRAQKPSQHLTVALDKTHFIPAVGPWPAQEANPGQLLFDEDGDFQGFFPITIDTTELADGWHTMAVVSTGPDGSGSECSYCLPSTTNFPSGVAKIWFYVQNAPPSNAPPYVDAGDDQAVLLGASAQLSATVYDDGMPSAAEVADWSVYSGPGIVSFADPFDTQTSASFSELGVYVLRLTVDDGKLSASDTVTVVVNSIIHAESQTGGSSESSTVSTAGDMSGAEGFHIASISTKPHTNVTSLSGLGLNWMPLRSQCAGRNQTGVSLWYADGVTAGAGTVTAQLDTAPRNAVIAVSRYTGDVTLGQILSGNTLGIDGACSGGVDSAEYQFDMAPASDSDTLVYSAAATRQTAHAPGAAYSTRDKLIMGSSGAAAGISIQDRPPFLNESPVVNGNFGWETDWAVVAVELHGTAVPTPPNGDPIADFGYACVWVDCSFTDLSTDSDGSVVAWSWNFGDGTGSSAQSPSHSYAAGGTYTVSLTVTDNDGATDNTSQSVMVAAPNTAPVADDQSVATPKNTEVDITLTGSDADGDPLAFKVTSGPSHGALAESGNPRTYTPDPDYTGKDAFTFSVSDGNYGSDTATVSINVKKGRGGRGGDDGGGGGPNCEKKPDHPKCPPAS
jgi:PKD repeat protein